MQPQYFIFTLGCQYNIYDSQEIEKKLQTMGIKKTADEKSATFIIANICSVRQKPIDRIFGKLRNWEKLKEKNPNLRLIATGCILPHDRKKFKKRFDLIFEIGNLKKLENYLKNEIDGFDSSPKLKNPSTSFSFKSESEGSSLKVKTKTEKTGFVPIMTGCNNFCTYCAVPYTRGREISFSKKQIIKKAKELIQKKVPQIILLGQNVNSYKYGFAELLEETAQLPGNFQLSFLTSHPKDLNQKIIQIMARNPKIKKELHLPLQSGNNRILKLMNRNYTREDYLNLIKMIRKIIPNIKLSTDIIVGFPTESKSEFEDTYNICKKIKFDKAYIAMYSPRPGTLAEKKLKNDVPYKEKKYRWRKLNNLINKK